MSFPISYGMIIVMNWLLSNCCICKRSKVFIPCKRNTVLCCRW